MSDKNENGYNNDDFRDIIAIFNKKNNPEDTRNGVKTAKEWSDISDARMTEKANRQEARKQSHLNAKQISKSKSTMPDKKQKRSVGRVKALIAAGIIVIGGAMVTNSIHQSKIIDNRAQTMVSEEFEKGDENRFLEVIEDAKFIVTNELSSQINEKQTYETPKTVTDYGFTYNDKVYALGFEYNDENIRALEQNPYEIPEEKRLGEFFIPSDMYDMAKGAKDLEEYIMDTEGEITLKGDANKALTTYEKLEKSLKEYNAKHKSEKEISSEDGEER